MSENKKNTAPTAEKPKDLKTAIKKLMAYLKPFKIQLIAVVCFAVLGAVFSIVGPKILGTATTKIYEGLVSKVNGTGVGIDFEGIWAILMILLALYIASTIFNLLTGIIMSRVSQKASYNLRQELSQKMNRMPLGYFDTRSYGDVLSRITNDVDLISQNLNQSMTQVITAITTIIGILIMMFSISWIMTLIAIIVLPISLLGIGQVVKRSQKYFVEQQQYLGKVNGQVEELYGGHTVVKAFNGETEAVHEFEVLNSELYNTAWRSQFLSGMLMPIMTFIGNIGYVLVAIVGGLLAIRQAIAVGDILAFIQYMKTFTQPISQTAQVANLIQSMGAASERVFEFLEEEEEIKTPENPVDPQVIQGEVVFKNVNFGYDPNKIIINDFSIEVKPGQRIAIVGPTGAGKTTLIKLLMRFYDVNSGGIYVNGHNIKDFDRGELRDAFGMVLQETWLYSGSIMENIRYGRLDATDEEVIEAAKAARVHHFVSTLPDGYNMLLNEEASNVSQGQKQLLTIARAILSKPTILILDEATSSVDTRTEIMIQEAMNHLMEGRTSFIIAHRLSTIKNADLILVMKDGDIIEQGTHLELMDAGGFYNGLYTSQFDTNVEA